MMRQHGGTQTYLVGVIMPASKRRKGWTSAFMGCLPVRRISSTERGTHESGVILAVARIGQPRYHHSALGQTY